MKIVISLDMHPDLSDEYNIDVIAEELGDAVIGHIDFIIDDFREKHSEILTGGLGEDNRSWATGVINNLKIARDSTCARAWGLGIKTEEAE